MGPLVSVICVSYNHESFIIEALNSVRDQTYPNIEMIIVDDGSRDKSVEQIELWRLTHPGVQFLNFNVNRGYCRAFNVALKVAKGEFIIDFATDDVMTPTQIEEQIKCFSTLSDEYGVVFTDAEYIDEKGEPIREHFSYLLKKGLIRKIPEGDVYDQVISTYFIPSPTMMSRANVFKTLQGYDENLAYEDFDFWVRSSRIFKYKYLPKVLTKIRRNITSMSSGWYKQGDRQLHSTYLVCRKALHLNREPKDKLALIKRAKYELRQSVFSENRKEAKLFYDLLKELKGNDWMDQFLIAIAFFNLPLAPIRSLYHKIRYQLLN